MDVTFIENEGFFTKEKIPPQGKNLLEDESWFRMNIGPSNSVHVDMNSTFEPSSGPSSEPTSLSPVQVSFKDLQEPINVESENGLNI